MSWLSDFLSALKPSSREEHFWAKIAGEEELENEYIPSSREEGFLYKIAQKTNSGGGGGYDPYVVEFDVQSMTTDADFATAKTKFLANEPVLFRAELPNGGVTISSADTFGNDGVTDIIAASFGDSVLQFKPNGTIVVM